MQISAWQRFLYSITGWRGFKYPTPPALPPRPWHPDGDAIHHRVAETLLPNSDAIIAHMKRHGVLRIRTGSTVPRTWDGSGVVEGYFLNRAAATDPVYLIQKPAPYTLPKPGTVYGSVFGTFGEGGKVRYHDRMVKQGEPAAAYSDAKVHIYDDIDGVPTITEIQNFRGIVNRVIQCDGISQYPLTIPSTEAIGRSAAKYPLAESAWRYDDLRTGIPTRGTMGTPMASSTYFLPPARGSDSGAINKDSDAHLDPDAVPMGAVLRLKPEAAERIQLASGRPPERRHFLDTVLASLTGPGVVVVDTGGHHAFGMEPDPRFDQAEMGVLAQLTLDDFRVYRDGDGDGYPSTYSAAYD